MSIKLSINIFKLSSNLPKSEDWALTSQIRRFLTSISTNIAEEFGRSSSTDIRRFYKMPRRSVFETIKDIIYGTKIQYFEQNQVDQLIKKYENLIFELNNLIKSFSQP